MGEEDDVLVEVRDVRVAQNWVQTELAQYHRNYQKRDR